MSSALDYTSRPSLSGSSRSGTPPPERALSSSPFVRASLRATNAIISLIIPQVVCACERTAPAPVNFQPSAGTAGAFDQSATSCPNREHSYSKWFWKLGDVMVMMLHS